MLCNIYLRLKTHVNKDSQYKAFVGQLLRVNVYVYCSLLHRIFNIMFSTY